MTDPAVQMWQAAMSAAVDTTAPLLGEPPADGFDAVMDDTTAEDVRTYTAHRKGER